MTAKAFGAVPVAISDVVTSRRAKAIEIGVDTVLDPSAMDMNEQVRALTGDGFDLIFEASGSPVALRGAFDFVRPGGTIVQIGTLGNEDVPLPANRLMNKEINFIGTMRYGNVFDEAIRLVERRRVDLRQLINGQFALDESARAFDFAADKTQSFKVQIEL